jgi:hypothetical protein
LKHSNGPVFPSQFVFPWFAELLDENQSTKFEMAGRQRDITTELDDADDSPDDSAA